MARPRKPKKTLQSIEECNTALGSLLVATIDREMAVAERDARLVEVREKYDELIAGLVNRERDLAAQIEHYYLGHLDELERDGRKSTQLGWGVIGRRKSPGVLKLLNKSWKWASVLAKLVSEFGKDSRFIRIADPEIDKETVKKAIAEGELNAQHFGLKIDAPETFFAEPDRNRSPEVAA